jgi:chromate reductase
MKVLGISGSIRKGSSNEKILQVAASFLPLGTEFNIFEGLQDIPHFDPDNKEEPIAFTKLKDALSQADAVIISTPEYAFGIPAILKNALEWTVGASGFNTKPTALITASTAGTKGHQSLLWVLEAIGTKMNEDTQLLIQFIRSKMDAEGNIKEEETLVQIRKVVDALLLLVEN